MGRWLRFGVVGEDEEVGDEELEEGGEELESGKPPLPDRSQPLPLPLRRNPGWVFVGGSGR